MNTLKFFFVCAMVFSVCLFSSCTDINDKYRKYIEKGEVIYTTKVDSVKTYPGKNRVQLSGLLKSGFNINKIVIYWNKGEKHHDFPYEKGAKEFDYPKMEDVDTLNLIVTDLPEGFYNFEVQTMDSDGNRSLKIRASEVSYGESFRKGLLPRNINYFFFDGSQARIEWAESYNLGKSTEVKYTNTSGEEIVTLVKAEDKENPLADINIQKKVLYRSYHLPTEKAIDSLVSDWGTYNFLHFLYDIAKNVTVDPVFGGIKVFWDNKEARDINVRITYPKDGEMKQKAVSSKAVRDSTVFSDMDAVKQNIVISVMDNLNSASDKPFSVKPLKEDTLNRANFQKLVLANDNFWGAWQGKYPHLYDGDRNTIVHTHDDNVPFIISLDLGVNVKLSRIRVFQRGDYESKAYGEGAPKKYTLYGLKELPVSNPEDLSQWHVLGTYIDEKPSGRPVGDNTKEDMKKYKEGNECHIDNCPEIRYFRMKITEVWGNTPYCGFGEISFKGGIISD